MLQHRGEQSGDTLSTQHSLFLLSAVNFALDWRWLGGQLTWMCACGWSAAKASTGKHLASHLLSMSTVRHQKDEGSGTMSWRSEFVKKDRMSVGFYVVASANGQ